MQFIKTTIPEIKALCDIYNYYIFETINTLYTKEMTEEIFTKQFLSSKKRFTTFTIYLDDIIAGFISLTQYKARDAYDTTAEVTLYFDKQYTGKGMGNEAFRFIENYAKENDFHTLIGVVCTENLHSIRLCEKNNFIKCAHLKEAGKKFDRFLDVVFFQKIL